MTGCNNVPYQIHLIHVLTPDKTVRSYQCKNFTGLVMAQNIQRATIERSAEITMQLNSLPPLSVAIMVVDKESGRNNKGYTEVIGLQYA